MSKVLAHTVHGVLKTGTSLAAPGTRQAIGGGEYLGHTRCMANEATCNGPRAKGTEYCVGHLRGMARDGGS